MFNLFGERNAVQAHGHQTWHQFESSVIYASQMALDPSEWRVKPQHNGSYIHAAGERVGLRVDIHVAEKRLGGRAFVIDAKHFTVAPLNRHELETTENYRRSMHASRAIVVTSANTIIPASVHRHAESMGRLCILPFDRSYKRALKRIARELRG